MAAGYPRRISDSWGGVPNSLDAALVYKGKTYFFKAVFKHRLECFRFSCVRHEVVVVLLAGYHKTRTTYFVLSGKNYQKLFCLTLYFIHDNLLGCVM